MRRHDATLWTPQERAVLDALQEPEQIQAYLDSIPYNDEVTCRSPRRVMRDRKAHCMEGALFAAAAFAHHGQSPRLIDLRAAKGKDDDHVIVVFEQSGSWGAVAKSNFTGLRFRCPVYRNLRELAMSYFEDYYNLEAERTLRSYSRPLRLSDRAFPGWRTADRELDVIGERLDAIAHVPLVTPPQIRRFKPVDKRRYDAGLMGSNPAGLFGNKG
ncbi:MAG: hypothetical protein HY303_04865 [Candidatus Wallbacteria bacterium]|nr:hypothetical protein [Candidatus Wallbacteria bacterium]